MSLNRTGTREREKLEKERENEVYECEQVYPPVSMSCPLIKEIMLSISSEVYSFFEVLGVLAHT